ncbi:DUF503 domain-containing protein [Alteribacillus sp. HJP-4]|uniref:DUF503 domain-containing protein n=1 Tax=Alteribacillus sp. HJP-4 TaxID=2775394 RepID=UPI0035CCDC66
MIGAVHCECMIYNAQSLKEKRSVLKSVVTRLRQKLNVSVSEMDHHDLWQRTAISIVCISNSRQEAEKELQKALELIDRYPELERTETDYEWL